MKPIHYYIITLYDILRFIFYCLWNWNTPRIRVKTNDVLIREFLEEEQKKFTAIYEKETTNINTDIAFYTPETYKECMKTENNEIETKWRNRIMITLTPRGNIVFYYDAYKMGFSYYCDQQSVPYLLLNALAMRYVRMYYCRDLFVDELYIPEGKKNPIMEWIKAETEKEMKKSMVQIKQPSVEKPNPRKTTNQQKQIEPIKERNRFIYIGKVSSFKPLIVPRVNKVRNLLFKDATNKYSDIFKQENQLQRETMDYQTYKKQMLDGLKKIEKNL